MTRTRGKRPTDGELEILRVIWSRGPSTVREVFRVLAEVRETGYTTVLKLMQIMAEKGTLQVDRSVRPQVYSPAESRKDTQRKLVADLLERAFGGAPGNLVLQALSASEASSEERQRIREMLDNMEAQAEADGEEQP